jgi:hypothetical protein
MNTDVRNGGSVKTRAESSVTAKVSFVISVIAFLLSSFNTFYAVIRQQDDVSGMLHGDFWVRGIENRGKTGQLQVRSTHIITVVNSGNRPATVTNVELQVRKGADSNKIKGCGGTRFYVVPYKGVKSASIKPGETADIPLRVSDVDPGDDLTKGWADVEGMVFDTDPMYYTACMEFTVLTPSGSEKNHFLLSSGHATKSGNAAGERGKAVNEPLVLSKHLRTIFW